MNMNKQSFPEDKNKPNKYYESLSPAKHGDKVGVGINENGEFYMIYNATTGFIDIEYIKEPQKTSPD